VIHLKPEDLAALGEAHWSREQWVSLLGVFVNDRVATNQADRPALLGSYQVVDKVVRFEPRFPLQPGVSYRVVLDYSHLPNPGNVRKPLVAEFTLPKNRTASTVVAQVYPTTNTLPENQLKFYLHFSAPMSRGEAYQHLHLLDAKGHEIELAFLELGEELWDPSYRRFTLFFDPGRIKRGLKPREDLGPVLEEGKTYTFVVDQQWLDAQSSPLKEVYKKVFQAGPPDDQPPDPRTWKVQAPSPGSKEPLVVTFPKPMDHAMLQRVLHVMGTGDKNIPGAIQVSDAETRWQFRPQVAWAAGTYSLVVEKSLEDLAGNSIGRPFEVDVLHPIPGRVETETIRVPFQVINH
jgi:hypothetical protein